MKVIPIRRDGAFKSLEIFTQLLSISPKGFNLEVMRKRVNVLGIIAKVPAEATEMVLEDAEHQMLWQVLDNPDWTTANVSLLQIVDDVKDAKSPPAKVKLVKDETQ